MSETLYCWIVRPLLALELRVLRKGRYVTPYNRDDHRTATIPELAMLEYLVARGLALPNRPGEVWLSLAGRERLARHPLSPGVDNPFLSAYCDTDMIH